MIILLDLNYTLVENSHVKKDPFSLQIEGEIYRNWLLELIRNYTTVLITARPEKYRQQTLKHFEETLSWQPDSAYFNSLNKPPHILKPILLERSIFPRYGKNLDQYLAIESNPKTIEQYKLIGINKCLKVM